MQTIFIILGKETKFLARGQFNEGLFNTAIETLKGKYNILTTIIEDGYDIDEEIKKFQLADFIIYQYPIFWFTHPGSLKEYIDDVFRYGDFFKFDKGNYYPIGLLSGKKFMLSTTWNSPADKFNDENSILGNYSRNDYLLPMIKTNTFCGMGELEHFSSHDMAMNPQFEEDKLRYIEHLTKIFKL